MVPVLFTHPIFLDLFYKQATPTLNVNSTFLIIMISVLLNTVVVCAVGPCNCRHCPVRDTKAPL